MALCPLQSPPFCVSGSDAGNGTLHPRPRALQLGQAVHCKSAALSWRGIRESRTTDCGGIARASSGSRLALAPTAEEQAPKAVMEFPAVESPAIWSKAERALVERTVDLEGLAPSPARRAELVEQVRAGAETGLFFLKNFGVDLGFIDEVREEVHRFFAQPQLEKVNTSMTLPVYDYRTYGYSFDYGGVYTPTATEGVVEPRFKEMFRVRMFPESARLEKAWPPALPSFKHKLIRYSEQMHAATLFMAELLAEGLGLPPSYIVDTYGGIRMNLNLNNLFPQPEGKLTGLPTHCDTNLFNFNVADGRGLQFYVDGEWLTSPSLPDCALFDVGEDLETISNGRYHATFHRVVAGPRTRLSILNSCDVGREEIIGPAPQLIDHHNPARYRTRRQADRTDDLLHSMHNSLKADRSKSSIVIDPARHLDRTKNAYLGDKELLHINGVPVAF